MKTGVDAEITASVKKAVRSECQDCIIVWGRNVSTVKRVRTSRSIAEEHVESTPARVVSIGHPGLEYAPSSELGMHLREHFIDSIDITKAVR